MADIDILPMRGVPWYTLVDANGVAVPGTPAVIATTTWNNSDKDPDIVLSNGNLTASLPSGSFNNGVRAVHSQTTGKFYFEVTCTAYNHANSSIGVASGAADLVNSLLASTLACSLSKPGVIYVDGVNIGSIAFGSVPIGAIVCTAIDLGTRKIWFRLGASGNWNMSATANPATGAEGVSIGASLGVGVALYPAVSIRTLNDNITANFGATAFSGTVPSGFTAGWPT